MPKVTEEKLPVLFSLKKPLYLVYKVLMAFKVSRENPQGGCGLNYFLVKKEA